MLKSKDKIYMKRAVDMIINWQRETYNPNIIHIHGDKDNTIPIKNVNVTLIVEEGSHMMALTMGERIGKIIAEQL
jgi:hypothetical protein